MIWRCSPAGRSYPPRERAVPSLRYQEFTPPYEDMLDNPDGISAPGPGGGYTQMAVLECSRTRLKFPLAANEMANRSPPRS
jgi:cytochrome c peroxidase